MSFKDLDNKTLRRILVITWFMLAIFNLIMNLYNPHPLGWILTGFLFGGAIIMIMDNSLINIQYKFIERLIEVNELYCNRLTEYLSKKVKGGKKT